jgi:hypothetical protein
MRALEKRLAGLASLAGPAATHRGAGCSPNSISTSSLALPYLFYDGMTFTLTLTGATVGGIVSAISLALMPSGLPWLAIPAAGYVNLMRRYRWPNDLLVLFLVPYIDNGSPVPNAHSRAPSCRPG